MDERLSKQLEFLIEADKMKTIFRQTLLIDKSRFENDAEHSWHIALMAIILFEHVSVSGVDLNRVVKMAIIHDLIEIYAGDTYAHDIEGNKGKYERELLAADKLFNLLPHDQAIEFKELWEEFEEMKTPDAMYANAVDRVQPFINNFKTDGEMWIKKKVKAKQVFDRMKTIENVLPKLWDFIQSIIKKATENGVFSD
ncbi:MAG: HD domain-containing protein [Christensenellaceae bacterium]|jgi:putative hydrolase of HD superfamily|nr:HD domain-containing protein [Christensenellaceae bacterium]